MKYGSSVISAFLLLCSFVSHSGASLLDCVTLGIDDCWKEEETTTTTTTGGLRRMKGKPTPTVESSGDVGDGCELLVLDILVEDIIASRTVLQLKENEKNGPGDRVLFHTPLYLQDQYDKPVGVFRSIRTFLPMFDSQTDFKFDSRPDFTGSDTIMIDEDEDGVLTSVATFLSVSSFSNKDGLAGGTGRFFGKKGNNVGVTIRDEDGKPLYSRQNVTICD